MAHRDSGMLPLLRALLECLPDAMVVINHAGEMILINSRTEELFGYAREELLGHSVERLFPTSSQDRHRATGEGSFWSHGVGSRADLELNAVRKDGGEFPAEVRLSPLQTPEGILVTAAVRDISDRKQRQAEISKLSGELQARVSELAESKLELEALSYSVSHDLGTPLGQIGGFAEILLEQSSSLTPAQRECLEHIQLGTRQMAELLAALLNFAPLARQPLDRENVELRGLVEEVISSLQPETHGRKVSWCIGPLSQANCDRALIRQAFWNLLSNAVKFTRPHDHAVIELGETRLTGERVLFIRDNGIGFDMKYADKLFAVFQRLHTQKEFEGTGMGLAIVHRIITKHGGRIWARSEAGSGTTFFFTLGPEPATPPE
jgi:PAS domain S-box-containing protein